MQVIILDEAHERTLSTDILFAIVKQLQVNSSARAPLQPVIPVEVSMLDETLAAPEDALERCPGAEADGSESHCHVCNSGCCQVCRLLQGREDCPRDGTAFIQSSPQQPDVVKERCHVTHNCHVCCAESLLLIGDVSSAGKTASSQGALLARTCG